MKITENTTFVNLDAYTRKIEGDQKINHSGKNIAKGTLKDDEVVLSRVAMKISETKKMLDSLPDVNEQKIAFIKAQIEEGTYRINAEGVASRMVRESLLNETM